MKFFLCVVTVLAVTLSATAQWQYPATKKVNQTDTFFGTPVADPYRWLEDDNAADTKDWVTAQNTVTQNYLATIPFRTKVKERLSALWNYPRYNAPFKRGEYYYFYKNDGLQNQSVLYRQKGLSGEPEVFIDPNKFSVEGTVAMGNITFSKNNKYCVYLISQSGSDWQTAVMYDIEKKLPVLERLSWIKFSGVSWKGDEGFYYSRYPKPEENNALSKKNTNHKVYYHKVGRPQQEDVLVYEDNDHPQQLMSANLTEDERYLILYKTEGTSSREIWLKDMRKSNTGFIPIIKGFNSEAGVIDNEGDKLLVRTNEAAPNYRIVVIDPANPAKDKWKEIVPTRTKLLQSASTVGGKLFLTYLEDAVSKVYQCSRQGKLEKEVILPGLGTASGFDGDNKDKELFYTYVSFNYPPAIFRYDITNGISTLFRKTAVKVNPEDYVSMQSFFTSKDGTKVPMFITYKKGLQLNGNNPVLLYGYGGFNIAQTPNFSVSNIFFMEQGGVYAVVNLRGGSEYGEDWHRGGMQQKKQNVFNDFIAAAEFLIDKKYTNKNKIAIRGGSNGGLLVGACMAQRPDLFKVALPAVGVMDMLRYHQFTIGWAWAVEYGRSDKSAADFKNLYGYSPLHNLKLGTAYPATMITTADHDDRVVPAHSFKFAARLQECQTGSNPTLIRIETKAGHGAGKPISKQIEEATDIWSFVMVNLGMEFK